MVNPEFLCRQHLLGEHKELHMLVGCILKNKSLAGYIKTGLIELHSISSRHEDLVVEMRKRGYNHHSPLPNFSMRREGKVNPEENLIELARRCERCRVLINLC